MLFVPSSTPRLEGLKFASINASESPRMGFCIKIKCVKLCRCSEIYDCVRKEAPRLRYFDTLVNRIIDDRVFDAERRRQTWFDVVESAHHLQKSLASNNKRFALSLYLEKERKKEKGSVHQKEKFEMRNMW